MEIDNYSDMFDPSVTVSMAGAGNTAATGHCVDRETMITDVELANAYVPFQKLCPTFTPAASLKNGTIFPGLYKPKWENRNAWGGE